MNKFFALGVIGALMAAPAMAAGPGTDYTFTVDASKSTVTFGLVGIGTVGVSPMSGSFSLNLHAPNGSGVTGDRIWNGHAELEDVDVLNDADLDFGSLFIFGSIAAGNFALSDWDSTDPDSVPGPSESPDVPPYGSAIGSLSDIGGGITSDGIVSDVLVTAIGGISIFGTPGPFGLFEYATPVDSTFLAPAPWVVEVADDDKLGVTTAGDVESHILLTSFVPTGDPLSDPIVILTIDLFGSSFFIPEPASVSLLALGGLGLLLRRRRAL